MRARNYKIAHGNYGNFLNRIKKIFKLLKHASLFHPS